MRKETFLLEIGTEEIPARFIAPALQQLQEVAAREMDKERLAYGQIRVLGTPRRLAILVEDVAAKQRELKEKKKGPAVKVAFDSDGNPSKAVLGFARAQGVQMSELSIEEVGGVPYVFALRRIAGQAVHTVLPALCERLLRSISFPKPMFWYSKDVRFARPIRWLTALWGSDTIPFTFAGLTSSNVTYGHRFLSADKIVLENAAAYEDKMRQNYVLVDPQEREKAIITQIKAEAEKLGGHTVMDEELLAEVVNLVEYPRAVAGEFFSAYLEIPQEVLITAMRTHQRYFPVFNQEKQLLPYFITISNGTSVDFLENVRTGNERVLRARLADARFFFEEDRKKSLDEYAQLLDNIVFMEPLGTMKAKTKRITNLVKLLAAELNIKTVVQQTAVRAAALAKADLMTHMVYEFPELQGIMGMHYARLGGEKEEVATAIAEHYAPRFAHDQPPASLAGALVALADKMDTLASCFTLGLIPTSSQDPYALRRSANGVVSILLTHKLAIPLQRLCELALAELKDHSAAAPEKVLAELKDFLLQRVSHSFAEQGIRYDVIAAVLGGTAHDLPGLWQRAQLLQRKLGTTDLTRILIPFTRAANLTKEFNQFEVDPALFSTAAEKELYQAVLAAGKVVAEAAAKHDFAQVFAALSPLYTPIERFFDDVMVMVKNQAVRRNRLALLALVKALFFTLGDISQIVQEKN